MIPKSYNTILLNNIYTIHNIIIYIFYYIIIYTLLYYYIYTATRFTSEIKLLKHRYSLVYT